MIRFTLFILLLGLRFTSSGQTNLFLIGLPDKDTIDHQHPVFNWFYTSSQQGRDIVRYNFILTELKKNQSAQSGVTVNQPLLRINGVQGFQLMYPYDAPKLEFNKRYGWQLEKTVNNVIVEKSEAWEFILYKPVKEPYKYAVLSTRSDATVYEAQEGRVFFKYQERYSLSGAKFYVYNKENKVIRAKLVDDAVAEEQRETTDELVVKTGGNFFELDVRSLTTGHYKLLVVNAKGQKYQLNFWVK